MLYSEKFHWLLIEDLAWQGGSSSSSSGQVHKNGSQTEGQESPPGQQLQAPGNEELPTIEIFMRGMNLYMNTELTLAKRMSEAAHYTLFDVWWEISWKRILSSFDFHNPFKNEHNQITFSYHSFDQHLTKMKFCPSSINTPTIISNLCTFRLLILARLGIPDSTTADTSIWPKLAASRRQEDSSCTPGFEARPLCAVGWTCSMRESVAWLW